MEMVTEGDNGFFINIHVIPNAKKNEIIGKYNNKLKIKISSPPVDGNANKEIKNFFAKLLKVKKSEISIVHGEKSREKKIFIKNKDIEINLIKKMLQGGKNANI